MHCNADILAGNPFLHNNFRKMIYSSSGVVDIIYQQDFITVSQVSPGRRSIRQP